jgi:hypothetical protein
MDNSGSHLDSWDIHSEAGISPGNKWKHAGFMGFDAGYHGIYRESPLVNSGKLK